MLWESRASVWECRALRAARPSARALAPISPHGSALPAPKAGAGLEQPWAPEEAEAGLRPSSHHAFSQPCEALRELCRDQPCGVPGGRAVTPPGCAADATLHSHIHRAGAAERGRRITPANHTNEAAGRQPGLRAGGGCGGSAACGAGQQLPPAPPAP